MAFQDISLIQNTEDKKNITIIQMYNYINNNDSKFVLENTLQKISQNNIVKWHARIEIITNLISLYYMVNRYKSDFSLDMFLKLIPPEDENKDNFEDLFNNYMEDMDVPLRYFYPKTQLIS
jgi:hypothetical protein